MAKRTVTIRVHEEAWDVLHENLEMDSKSSSFDRDLRKEISKALDSIKATEHKEIGKRWPRETRWTLRMPAWAWDTISETLEMDMNSKWIDKELREQIEEAYEQVEVV